jgi:hypothetical protein
MTNTARKLLLGLLGGSASFCPLSLPGLLAWWDSSDASTLFQASNGTTPAVADADPVGYCGDKSGNGKHATQTTAGSRPALKLAQQNGRNVLRFASDFLSASLPATIQPFSVALVVKQDGTFTVTMGGVLAVPWYVTSNGGTTQVSAGTLLNSGEAATGVWTIVSAVFNGLGSSVQVNNKTPVVGDAGTLALSNIGIGAYYAGEGAPAALDVGEAVIMAGKISSANRSALHSYLNTKWGVY